MSGKPPQVKVVDGSKCQTCGSVHFMAKWAHVRRWTKDDKAIEVVCNDCGGLVEVVKVRRTGNDFQNADFGKFSEVVRVDKESADA